MFYVAIDLLPCQKPTNDAYQFFCQTSSVSRSSYRWFVRTLDESLLLALSLGLYVGACYLHYLYVPILLLDWYGLLPDDYSLLMLEAWHSLPLTRLKDDGGGKTDIIC
jgi:hypothetical protein